MKQTTQLNTQFTNRRTYFEALEELNFVTQVHALAERCILVGVNTSQAVRTLARCEFCSMQLQFVLANCNINGTPPKIATYPISVNAQTH